MSESMCFAEVCPHMHCHGKAARTHFLSKTERFLIILMHKPIYVTLDSKIIYVNICMDLCKQTFYIKDADEPRVKGDVQALGYILLIAYF